jgi:DNA-binding response OmpR family regulator
MTDCPTCGRPFGEAHGGRNTTGVTFPVFDFRRRFVVLQDGPPIHLTVAEAEVLEYLHSNAPNVCTAQSIGWHVWRDLEVDARNNLRIAICHLRKKFADITITIHTARGRDFDYLGECATGYWLTW